jgi:predicted unusual protein kinase regulating ubiquinone biosynthesis (AarF/ABC1/UbiB family)
MATKIGHSLSRLMAIEYRLVWNLALGVVFILTNLFISYRRDIFPPKICFHLSKLQRNAQTHPWKFTQEVLDEAFGPVRVAGLLTEVDQVPIGSGCCAQVCD